nr:uncharacterized protein LOC109158743 [Ipomoea batatas]
MQPTPRLLTVSLEEREERENRSETSGERFPVNVIAICFREPLDSTVWEVKQSSLRETLWAVCLIESVVADKSENHRSNRCRRVRKRSCGVKDCNAGLRLSPMNSPVPSKTTATPTSAAAASSSSSVSESAAVQSGNQKVAGVTAEEADLLRRSTKKTKRGARERDEENVQMEEDGVATQMQESQNINEERTGQVNQLARRPTRPLGDKYGSWMIAQRKPRNYQNNGDPKRNSGKTTGGRNDNGKGKGGGNYGSNTGSFNKAGFTIWNNSRSEGLSSALLSGKGKRPQVQITEAQVLNGNSRPNRETTVWKQRGFKERQGTRSTDKSTDKSKKHPNQAAETENHTVVRGFEMGNRVEKTVITDEGRTTEVFQFQAGTGDHHQDPPDDDKDHDTGGTGDPMTDVVYDEGQTSAGLEVVEQ